MQEFTVTSEFERWTDPFDPKNDCSFVHVFLPDGRCYALNVWTFGYFSQLIEEHQHDENFIFHTSPNLFVKELTRECVEQAIQNLLIMGEIDEVVEDPVFFLDYSDPWIDASELEDGGVALEEKLKAGIAPGHYLYGKDFSLEAKRKDKALVLVKLEDKQLAMMDLDQEAGQNPKIAFRIFPNSKAFWKEVLREDILNAQSAS